MLRDPPLKRRRPGRPRLRIGAAIPCYSPTRPLRHVHSPTPLLPPITVVICLPPPSPAVPHPATRPHSSRRTVVSSASLHPPLCPPLSPPPPSPTITMAFIGAAAAFRASAPARPATSAFTGTRVSAAVSRRTTGPVMSLEPVVASISNSLVTLGAADGVRWSYESLVYFSHCDWCLRFAVGRVQGTSGLLCCLLVCVRCMHLIWDTAAVHW